MASKSSFLSSPKSSIMPWLGIAAFVLLADQLSKLAIIRFISYAETKVITSYFNLVLVYNKLSVLWRRCSSSGICSVILPSACFAGP
jgi:hypothetical protein